MLLVSRKRRRQADAAANDAIQHALWERAHVQDMRLLASRPDAADLVSRARDAARKRRADVAALKPKQRAVRHAAIVAAWRRYTALRAASRTALQDFQRSRRGSIGGDRRRSIPRRERASLRAPTAQLSSRRGRGGSHERCKM